MFSSEFMRVLSERGFIHQCTDEAGLDALAADGRVSAYIGFDCTADSLHVGSLVQIMMLRWLQTTGHRPIVLLGGGTTKIGDPSGRDQARGLLSEEAIAANKEGIRRSFSSFLSFGDGAGDALLVDNADWLDTLGYIPLLRDIGAHFSINRMLTFDSVRLRLDREQPLSFLEFNYMILQAYDFLELSRREDCRLQMGGSDQWGNIVNGVELARRIDGRGLYGLTTPLVTLASGAKMGKTAQGAVWLNPDRLSAYDYWQYWRNTHDDDVVPFMKLFTELPLGEIARHEALEGAELNDSKKLLANEATPPLPRRRCGRERRRDGAPDFRGRGGGCGPARHPGPAQRARSRHSRVRALSEGGALRLGRGGAAPHPRRRRPHERHGDRFGNARDRARRYRCRRPDQALRRQEAPRPDPPGLARLLNRLWFRRQAARARSPRSRDRACRRPGCDRAAGRRRRCL